MVYSPDLILLIGAAGLILLGIAIAAVAMFARPKVVELRLDPPEAAHYLTMPDDEDENPNTKEAINRQKEQEIFYHAFFYLAGDCSSTKLYPLIKERWNKQYESWPEYKRWKIGKNFVEQTLKEWDFHNSGRVIEVTAANSGGLQPGYFVLLDFGGKVGRNLVSVEKLVEKYLEAAPAVDVETVVRSSLKVLYSRPSFTELPIAAD